MLHRKLLILGLPALLALSIPALSEQETLDPLITDEFEHLRKEDRQGILGFASVGDGWGELPNLPLAILGPDGIKGTDDDLEPPEWAKLRMLLAKAQNNARLAAEDPSHSNIDRDYYGIAAEQAEQEKNRQIARLASRLYEVLSAPHSFMSAYFDRRIARETFVNNFVEPNLESYEFWRKIKFGFVCNGKDIKPSTLSGITAGIAKRFGESELEQRDPDGNSILHYAAECGTPSTVRALTEHGFDPNERNTYGQTALHLAISARRNSAKYLLEVGADPQVSDEVGYDALSYAVSRGRLDTYEPYLAPHYSHEVMDFAKLASEINSFHPSVSRPEITSKAFRLEPES